MKFIAPLAPSVISGNLQTISARVRGISKRTPFPSQRLDEAVRAAAVTSQMKASNPISTSNQNPLISAPIVQETAANTRKRPPGAVIVRLILLPTS
jgi:hypothetical protein